MQEIWEEAANTVWVSHPTTLVAARDNVSVEVDPAGTVYYQTLAPTVTRSGGRRRLNRRSTT